MATRTRTRLRLAENFNTLIARAGLSKRELSRRSGVSYATIKALENPDQHPRRRGGMHPTTAWKMAKAYAEAASVDEETAFARLVVEEPADAVAA
jgi:hypothetical protein